MRTPTIAALAMLLLIALPQVKLAPAKDAQEAPLVKHPVLFDSPEADAIMAKLQIFPADNPWNTDISGWPVAAGSDKIISSIGNEKPLRYNADMAFVIVGPDQKKIDVKLSEGKDESDPGPYPIPDNMPIEGWPAGYKREPSTAQLTLDDVQRDKLNRNDDRHAIVVDPANHLLYEFYQAKKVDGGWQANQASIFDLASNKMRPDGWTSTDAAGLPILPAIVRYDEIKRGVIAHALRVGVRNTRRAYVYPATHYASSKTDPNLPRMGERIRLKQDFDISGYSPPVAAILKALKKYGMFVADNGLEWTLSVAPDERIPVMHEELRRISGSDFEVVHKPQ